MTRKLDAAYMLPGVAEPLKLQSREEAAKQKFDLIPGFVRGKNVEHPEHFPPPKLPAGYKPIKVFPSEASQPGKSAAADIDLLQHFRLWGLGSGRGADLSVKLHPILS